MNIDSITLAAVTGGTVQGPACFFSGVALDSRETRDGDLFVAIPGPKHDGHDFLAEALARASGAFVSRSVPKESIPAGRTLIRVGDTLGALRAFARYVRETLRPKVVGITGTVGKTTTKEMTAALLSRKFRVARSSGNLNNTIGLPAELARLPEDVEVAVLELGMSTPGEIRILSELARPDAATVTAVTPVHLMNFPGLDAVTEAKAEILAGMSRESIFAANADDERCLAIAARHAGPVVTFGVEPKGRTLDVAATEIVEDGASTQLLLHVSGQTYVASLPLPGRHNVSNFLAATALATALGVSAAEIVHAALELSPARHRGEILRLANDLVVYDDSYNSSPAALVASFAAFEAVAGSRRRIAVVGEMLELGRRGEDLHREAGRDLARRCQLLVAVRGEAAALAEAARRAGGADVRFVESVEAAIPLVTAERRPGDAVFVKGSRGVGLDRLVGALALAAGTEGAS